jgi:hypothetical protein
VSPASDERDLVRAAARNNAELCELVCAAHDAGGAFARDAWTSARRTPELYPDAVTLEPTVDAAALLDRIDSAAGASVKDSFATLDLRDRGFRVLFDATWITRPPAREVDAAPEHELRWSTIDSVDALEAWEAAWSEDGTACGRFPATLLTETELVFLYGETKGSIVAGAMVNRSAAVVGVSNLFFTTGASPETWAGCVDEISMRFPGVPIVGYEPNGLLGGPYRAGFRSIGPLRVWIKD